MCPSLFAALSHCLDLWVSLTSGENDEDEGDGGGGDGPRNRRNRRGSPGRHPKSAPKQDPSKATHVTYLYNNANQAPQKTNSDQLPPHTDDGYVVGTGISEQEKRKRLNPDGEMWYCGPKSDSDGSATKLLKQSGRAAAGQQSDTDLFSSRCVLFAFSLICVNIITLGAAVVVGSGELQLNTMEVWGGVSYVMSETRSVDFLLLICVVMCSPGFKVIIQIIRNQTLH